jgi:DnaJ homologue, subfamily C, member 28, conserved domain
MDVWNLIAERKIQEAMEEGAFDRLEGTGRPISLEENPHEDPAQRMAHRLLRNNGFAPAWILESKDLDADIGRLNAVAARLEPGELERRTADLNRRIGLFNLKTPIGHAQKLPVSYKSPNA